MVGWIVVITIIIATAGAIMIRAVVITVIIIKIPPAAIADAHADHLVFSIPVLLFSSIAVIILVPILVLSFDSYRRIIYVVGGLTAFVGGGATAESGYSKGKE